MSAYASSHPLNGIKKKRRSEMWEFYSTICISVVHNQNNVVYNKRKVESLSAFKIPLVRHKLD